MTASHWMHLDAPARQAPPPQSPWHPRTRQALVALACIAGPVTVLAVLLFALLVISGLPAGAAGGCGGG